MRENWSGSQIGDFVVEERIARGGISSLYRARQVSVNRYVALKIIDLGEDVPDQARFRDAFQQEVATNTTLEHIHILPVYGYGMIDDHHAYIAMRMLTGGSVSDLIRRAPISIERVADLLTDVAQALDYAHRKGVLHGDLKPSNILLDDAGRAYLSDFGVTTLLNAELDPGFSASMMQLPLYTAPERLRGEPGDSRADIYSLGAVAYHLLTGRPPFEVDEGGLGGLVFRHLEQEPIPPRTLNPDISPSIDGLIMRALRKSPSDRFPTAGDMMQAFNTAIGKTTLDWRLPAAITTPPRARRRWLWLLPLLVLGLVAAALLTFTLTRPPLPTEQPPLVINTGEHLTLDALVPDNAAVERARAVLGSHGFIAYLNCSMQDVLFAARARHAREFAESNNLRLQVYDSHNDIATQLAQIEEARREGARAFIICPAAISQLLPEVNELHTEGLPVVWATLTTDPLAVKLDADNHAVGQRVGERAAQIFNTERGGEGTYLIVSLDPFPASLRRVEGIIAAMEANAPDVELLENIQLGGRDFRTAAQEEVSKRLAEGVRPDAVLAISDSGAYGAINALTGAGIDPADVFVLGVGGEAFALDLLRSDTYLQGTVASDQRTAGRLMMSAIILMLAGNPVPEFLNFPPGGVVTPETVDSYQTS